MDKALQREKGVCRHNMELDLLKFFSAWMIIFLHYSELFLGKAVCIGGYVCVEMFFIISGYLMCTGLERLQADRPVGVNAAEFIAKKIKHLYPYVLAAFCVYYIPLCSQAVRVPDEMENQIWGLLLLSQTGLGGVER